MSNESTQSLADSMKAGLAGRPARRLESVFGKGPPPPVAVPLDQDAYEIRLDHVEPDPHQPRKTFDEDELRHLAASISENGLLQPIIVYRSDDPTKYRIIAGERRYRAAQRAGLSTVPCLEMPPDFDRSLVDQLQLVENIQRADLRPLEAAAAIEIYIERHGLSQREAAKKLGKPLSFVTELLTIRKIRRELLARDGVERLPKQTLVEIGRAAPPQQDHLLEEALSGAPFHEVRERRANREQRPRVVYFAERFPLENAPPIDIRWKKHPEEVTDHDLAEALSAIVQSIATRAQRR